MIRMLLFVKKVIIRTDDKKVSILYSDDDEEFVEVTGNTNIINTEELLFNESYLKKNSNIIASFIRGVVLTKNVSTLSIVDEGLIDKEEALLRIEPEKLNELLHPTFDDEALNELFELPL